MSTFDDLNRAICTPPAHGQVVVPTETMMRKVLETFVTPHETIHTPGYIEAVNHRLIERAPLTARQQIARNKGHKNRARFVLTETGKDYLDWLKRRVALVPLGHWLDNPVAEVVDDIETQIARRAYIERTHYLTRCGYTTVRDFMLCPF